MKALVILVFAVVLHEIYSDFPPTLEIKYGQGTIVGVRRETDFKGTKFYEFKGIPYARPPVGDLRLKPPVGNEKWDGKRNGSWTPPVCPQYIENVFIGEEDCLYLNVYIPWPPPGGFPVIVFIHGGGFINGGAAEYFPLLLMEFKVILVVVQYRLGILGFLSAEDATLPGNFGLRDQSMALKWVNDYIDDFGGDPDRVTLLGTGSGAASVHYQILSPYSKDLFSRAIMQSGSALCPRMLRKNHAYVASELITKFKCHTPDSPIPTYPFASSLLECLKDVPVEELTLAYSDFLEWNWLPIVTLPRVDGDFLPDHPAVLLREGRYNKVDIIAGYNLHDGSIITANLYSDPILMSFFKDEFQAMAPLLMAYEEEEKPVLLAAITYQRLIGTKNIEEADGAEALTKLFTERLYSMGIRDAVDLHAKTSTLNQIYYYKLSHRGNFSFCNLVDETYIGNGWVCNGDDRPYFFYDASGLTPLEDDDLHLQVTILSLWLNFAAYGVATPDDSLGFLWEEYTSGNPWQLEIMTSPRMILANDNKTLQFWHSLDIEMNKYLFPNGIEGQIDNDDEKIDVLLPLYQTALDDKLQSEEYRRSIVLPNKIEEIDPTNQFEKQGLDILTGIVIEDLIAAFGMWSMKSFPNSKRYDEYKKYKDAFNYSADKDAVKMRSDTSEEKTDKEVPKYHTKEMDQEDHAVKPNEHSHQIDPENRICYRKPVEDVIYKKSEQNTCEKSHECSTSSHDSTVAKNYLESTSEKLTDVKKDTPSIIKETQSKEKLKNPLLDSDEMSVCDSEPGFINEHFNGIYSNSNIIDKRDIAKMENANLYDLIQAGLMKAQVLLKGVTEGESVDDVVQLVDKDNLVDIVDTYGEYVLLYLKDVRVTPEQMEEMQREQDLVCFREDSISEVEEKPQEKLLEKPIVLPNEQYPNKKKIIYGKIDFHVEREMEVPMLISSKGDGGGKSL